MTTNIFSIELEIYSNFKDGNCDSLLYTSVLDGNLDFFDDAQFTSYHDESDPYVIGQDTIYCQVDVTIPDDGSGVNYNVFDMDLINVFVCTVPEANEGNMTANLDQVSGQGGCLSALVDTDGLHHVIANGVANLNYGAEIHLDTLSNRVRFSFDTFGNGRESIFVHVQTMLDLQPLTESRRLLLADGEERQTSNQFRHFVENVGVRAAPIADGEGDFITTTHARNAVDMQLIIILISIVGVVCVISFAAVCFLYFLKERKTKKHLSKSGLILSESAV